MADDLFKTSLHTPAHLFRANAIYILTAATYNKLPLVNTDQRKQQWLDAFRTGATLYGWQIIAWVVLSNHYHVIVRAPEENAVSLTKFVASYHKFTARQWNDEDSQTKRPVWWNYWDTCIRSEKDYLARFNYVHWNPVKHRIANHPIDYGFSSYAEFFSIQPETIRTIEGAYPFDQVRDVPDEM